MSLIEWNDNLVLNIEPIDTHHKHLVDLLNKAQDSFMHGVKPGEVEQIMKELVDYANYHFAAEEALMHQREYPDEEKHLQEHASFRSWVAGLIQEGNPDDLESYMEIANVLVEWLVSHIQEIDRKLGLFLNTAQAE